MTEVEHPLYDRAASDAEDYSIYDKKKAQHEEDGHASSWNPFASKKPKKAAASATPPQSPMAISSNPFSAHHAQLKAQASTSAIIEDFTDIYGGHEDGGGGDEAAPAAPSVSWSPFGGGSKTKAPASKPDDEVVMMRNPNSTHLMARQKTESALVEDFDQLYDKKPKEAEKPSHSSWNPFSAKKAPKDADAGAAGGAEATSPKSPVSMMSNPFSLHQQSLETKVKAEDIDAADVYGAQDPTSPVTPALLPVPVANVAVFLVVGEHFVRGRLRDDGPEVPDGLGPAVSALRFFVGESASFLM